MPPGSKKKTSAPKPKKTVEPAGITKAAAKKPSRQALEDKAAAQAKELEQLHAELAKIKAREAAAAQKTSKKKSPKMARPKGPYKLIVAMRLADDKPKYNAIMSGVRGLAWRSKLDFSKEFREQPAEELGYVFKVARKHFKYLRRFENDWATADLIAQTMRNKRKAARRNGTLPPAKKGKSHQAADNSAVVQDKENHGTGLHTDDESSDSSSSDDEADNRMDAGADGSSKEDEDNNEEDD
ncbi:hypothetical protein B0H21DRAFT_891428 [Amylocystis lapponica]|nr:hypothetical protein B0H21DRAFT_891428 [Amylocystis lapponica]